MTINYSSALSESDNVSEKYDWKSDIQTYGVKPSLTWYINNKHTPENRSQCSVL